MSKKSSNPQTVQQHSSPEQIKAKMAQDKEVKRQRELINKQVYPAVLKATKSISDASQFISVLLMSIRKQFMNQMVKQTVKDLKLVEQMDMTADRAEAYKAIIMIFENENISTTTQLLEGLGNAIDSFVREELGQRPLTSLKTDFLE